jgi:hypothetical protein
MKSDAITKGYESITNKQRAALFFHYVTHENELEANRLLSSVPRKTYIMNDMEFVKWEDGFSLLAMVFAHEHWFARHGLMAAVLRVKIASAKKEAWEEWDATIEDVQYWSKLLLSLDAALLAAADKHGFDVQCVYRRARTEPYKPKNGSATTDAEIQAVWTDTFNMILESSFG